MTNQASARIIARTVGKSDRYAMCDGQIKERLEILENYLVPNKNSQSVLSFRVTKELRDELEKEANEIGVSLADIIRWRLLSGKVPKVRGDAN